MVAHAIPTPPRTLPSRAPYPWILFLASTLYNTSCFCSTSIAFWRLLTSDSITDPRARIRRQISGHAGDIDHPIPSRSLCPTSLDGFRNEAIVAVFPGPARYLGRPRMHVHLSDAVRFPCLPAGSKPPPNTPSLYRATSEKDGIFYQHRPPLLRGSGGRRWPGPFGGFPSGDASFTLDTSCILDLYNMVKESKLARTASFSRLPNPSGIAGDCCPLTALVQPLGKFRGDST